MRSSATPLDCGTKSQPWVIEAPTGQHITVSLLEFGQKTHQTTEVLQNCERYGTVVEKSTGRNVSICGHGQERNKMVYKSHSNIVEVVLDVGDYSATDKPRIFIGFQGRLMLNVHII